VRFQASAMVWLRPLLFMMTMAAPKMTLIKGHFVSISSFLNNFREILCVYSIGHIDFPSGQCICCLYGSHHCKCWYHTGNVGEW